MNVFLTGATGFIGNALANRLAAAGHAVSALVRPGSADSRLDAHVKRLTGRLDDATFMANALRNADAVCHLAGTTKAFSARGFRLVNENLTKGLVEATRQFGQQRQVFLHVSSQAAIGPCAAAPGLAETDRPAPVSQYGLSKLLGERAALSLAADGRRVAVIRPPMVYGPGDLAFLPLYRLMDLGWLSIPGPVDQPFSVIHVDDLVAGMELVLDALVDDRASGGVYHLAGPKPSCWSEYAEAFSAALRRPVRPLRVPMPLLGLAAWANAFLNLLGLPTSHLTPDKHREARQEGWLLDDTKARREFGYAPRMDIATGARDVIGWCQAMGLLGGQP